MDTKTVDCIILAMLKEERELFLSENTCFAYDKTKKHDNFLEFTFFDKDNKLRKGVFCSSDREMGNNEASKLFYKISRTYQSDLIINIGVVGYIDEVNIGDVIIVDENYSLCEKNVANTRLQKTDAKIDQDFIREQVCGPLERYYSTEFEKCSQFKLEKLKIELEKYATENKLDNSIKTSLDKICAHSFNEIKLGACATYHSVVKDNKTREAIKEVRKTNIVDMEAYYFNDWHKLIRRTEYPKELKSSRMIMIKSISDTALKKEKKILEAVGSRKLAMSNIYDVVSYYISNIYEFSLNSNKNLMDYFNTNVSNKHIDKLINYTDESYDALENLCPYLIINNKLNNMFLSGKYIETACNILKKENQVLILEGNPGKGKSTFISYVYKKVSENQAAIFISIPEILNENNKFSPSQSLYLLERLLQYDKGITVFIDGVEGSRHKQSIENKKLLENLIELLNKYGNRNVSLCIGAWHTNDANDIKKDIINKINTNSEVSTLTFKSVSALDDEIDDFILKFAEFYKHKDYAFNVKEYVNSTKNIIKNNTLQLRYVDFRLLYIFAKKRQALMGSTNISDFIEAYCESLATDGMENAIADVAAIFKSENPNDKYGLLTKNIYSRAFIFAKFIYQTFVSDNKEMIHSILTNKYILSDNINLFLEYILNNHANDAKRFTENVLKSFEEEKNCQLCSKIQLLYNISSIKSLSFQKKKKVEEYILSEIKQFNKLDLFEQESDVILSYRTLSIILNNKFGLTDYLQKFNTIISSTNNTDETNIVKKINQNFHLLYYSQMEFTYDKVEENVLFESEVIWNTYHILKKSINSPQFNNTYIETCAITLAHIINYILTENSQLVEIFSKDELSNCLNNIKEIQLQRNLVCVEKILQN